MSIQITVLDPANTSPKELSLVVDMINYFIANNTHAAMSQAQLNGAALTAATTATWPAAIPNLPVHPDDNPAAGSTSVTADQAFNAASGNPAAAFPNAAQTAAPAPMPNGGQLVTHNTAPMAGQAPTLGLDLDKNGLPWDARIHAKAADGGGTKNADGTWRGKRSVDPLFVQQVSAELRQALAAPAAPGANLPNGQPGVPGLPALGVPPLVPTFDTSLATAAPAVSTVVTANVASPTAGPTNFIEMAGKVGGLIASGALSQDQLKNACQMVGLTDLTQLPMRPDLIPAVNTFIDSFVAGNAQAAG